MKKGSVPHERALQVSILGHEMKGHRLINLDGKSPDAIEIFVEDGKIIVNAIEIMSGDTKSEAWRQRQAVRNKIDVYSSLGFDQVIVYEYFKDVIPHSKRQFTP